MFTKGVNPTTQRSLAILGEKDLMAMKIDAIASRGKMRDFIDLYFLCQKNTFSTAFSCYRKKYENHDVNFFHALRSLNYFAEAEKDESGLPKMLVPCDWKEVKKFFLLAVPPVAEEYRKFNG